ncbi:hypothetical protein PVAP13_6NG279116 [Panicum virgatum]|uniref:Uncharacterized protein n=1 Tax=Panicum virgatum TaxID=38727 RepID=A0A8T0R2B7_PANVG|nr:hypothetical protein PVAP13_6NG279116 [Panicum virgatum]
MNQFFNGCTWRRWRSQRFTFTFMISGRLLSGEEILASSSVEGICGNSRSCKQGKEFSEGHEAGRENWIPALGWPNMLHASDDKNCLAQRKQTGLRRTAVKKSAQICGISTRVCELPGAKNFAHSLVASAFVL